MCSVRDCNKECAAKGFCNQHYYRWKKKGSPTARIIRDPNGFVDCGDHWEIKLYNRQCEHIASAKIDPEDVEKCRKYKWHLHDGYAASGNGSSLIFLHKFVMGVTDPSIMIDHVHGIILDDRRSQLRVCNHAQNIQSQKLSKVNTSGERNVCWDKQAGKWKVEINAFDKKYNIGLFINYDEACQVARIERQRLHKEFARDK